MRVHAFDEVLMRVPKSEVDHIRDIPQRLIRCGVLEYKRMFQIIEGQAMEMLVGKDGRVIPIRGGVVNAINIGY